MFYEKKLLQRGIISVHDNIVVGVSGGPDSMALLHYFIRIKNKYKLTISVAHINHHTRADENEKEKLMIIDYCKTNKIPYYIGDFRKQSGSNFHEAARNFRYNFFIEIANKVSANKIALAHHQDDQVETILFKISRGNHLGGYVGMREVIDLDNNLKIIRPLLNFTKSEIIDYCAKNNVSYAIDSSNFSNKYTRNSIRNKIVPLFKEIQPDFNNKIIQFHEQLNEVNDYLAVNAKILIKEMIISNEKDRIILDLNKLKKTHVTLIRVILLNVVNQLTKAKFNLTYEKFKNLFNIIFNQKPNITFNLGKNMYCIKAYDRLCFRIGLDHIKKYEIVVNEFKNYQLPNGMIIDVKKVKEKAKINNKTLILCYNSTVWPLVIRTRQNGDYIQTKIGKKKVNRIFIDAKIPINLRVSWPLLVDKYGKVIWVIGIQKPDIEPFHNNEQLIKIQVLN
jgi:tRNA(Ile)-lysidine synthetase-like protein